MVVDAAKRPGLSRSASRCWSRCKSVAPKAFRWRDGALRVRRRPAGDRPAHRRREFRRALDGEAADLDAWIARWHADETEFRDERDAILLYPEKLAVNEDPVLVAVAGTPPSVRAAASPPRASRRRSRRLARTGRRGRARRRRSQAPPLLDAFRAVAVGERPDRRGEADEGSSRCCATSCASISRCRCRAGFRASSSSRGWRLRDDAWHLAESAHGETGYTTEELLVRLRKPALRWNEERRRGSVDARADPLLRAGPGLRPRGDAPRDARAGRRPPLAGVQAGLRADHRAPEAGLPDLARLHDGDRELDAGDGGGAAPRWSRATCCIW